MKKNHFQARLSLCFFIFIFISCSFYSCEELQTCEVRNTEWVVGGAQLQDLVYEEKSGTKRILRFRSLSEVDLIGPICTSKTIDIKTKLRLWSNQLPEVPTIRIYRFYHAPGPSGKELSNYFVFQPSSPLQLESIYEKFGITLPSANSEFDDATWIQVGVEFVFTSRGDFSTDLTYILDNVAS